MRADISDQWSWASSAARIPQISDLTVALAEPIAHARITVVVRDADVQFGTKVAFEGQLDAGTSVLGSVHVPLSARVMSQVEERRGAECVITLEDVRLRSRACSIRGSAGRPAARPLAMAGRSSPVGPASALASARQTNSPTSLQEDPDRPDVDVIERELEAIGRALRAEGASSALLSRSLLASFVQAQPSGDRGGCA